MAVIDDIIDEIKAIRADIRDIKEDVRQLKAVDKEVVDEAIGARKIAREIYQLLTLLIQRPRLERLFHLIRLQKQT